MEIVPQTRIQNFRRDPVNMTDLKSYTKNEMWAIRIDSTHRHPPLYALAS